MPPSNQFEARARARKVARLAACIDDYLNLFRIETFDALAAMRTWSQADWAWLAREAGTKPPSDATVFGVIEIFEQRAQRAAS